MDGQQPSEPNVGRSQSAYWMLSREGFNVEPLQHSIHNLFLHYHLKILPYSLTHSLTLEYLSCARARANSPLVCFSCACAAIDSTSNIPAGRVGYKIEKPKAYIETLHQQQMLHAQYPTYEQVHLQSLCIKLAILCFI